MSHRQQRGITLVEIGITIAIIGILVLVMPRGLAAIQTSAELELQRAVAHKVAEGALASSLNDDYANLADTDSETVGTTTVVFEEDGTEYAVEFLIQRKIVTDTSLGADKEFKQLTIRVIWPAVTDGSHVGEVVKTSLKSEE